MRNLLHRLVSGLGLKRPRELVILAGVGIFLAAGAIAFMFGHGPADKDLDRLGVLRIADGYLLFSCVDSRVDLAEITDPQFNDTVWRAEADGASSASKVLPIGPPVPGYDITSVQPLDEDASYRIQNLELISGASLQVAREIDLRGVGVGEGRSADGQRRDLRQLRTEFPDCGLPTE